MLPKKKIFAKKLSDCFETTVEIPRIRAGKRQTIKPLIMEEEK
jgi:hypothetical protein